MHNQDIVVARLTRIDINDMHTLMLEYADAQRQLSLGDLINSHVTHVFLLSHGWDSDEYVRGCVNCKHERLAIRRMCEAFSLYYLGV